CAGRRSVLLRSDAVGQLRGWARCDEAGHRDGVSSRTGGRHFERSRHIGRELVAGRTGSGTQDRPMILTESELAEALTKDRAEGHTMALANGCFDLLHVGHVRYLQGAAAEADRLVVAVNDDGSVATLKGAGRPILPAADRAELVDAVRGVDYVVIFRDLTVER